MFGTAAKRIFALLLAAALLICPYAGRSGDAYADSGPGPVGYEAEAEGNVLTGNASVSACEACSGGSKVGGLYKGSSVQFGGIAVAEAGTYKLTVYYLSGDARSANLSANGGDKEYVSFPATADWDTVGSYDVVLQLQAGANDILVDDNNWYAPDIDRLVVDGPVDPDGGDGGGEDPQQPPGTVYEAEDEGNALTGNASVSECPICSGGGKVGGLYQGSSITFPNVAAETAGEYELTLSFISGDPRSFNVSVNGGEEQVYDSLKTADWNTVGAFKLTVALAAGANSIKLSDGGGYSPDLDAITVRPAVQDNPPDAEEGAIGEPQQAVSYGTIRVTPYTAGVKIATGAYTVTYHTATGFADFEWTNGQKVTGVFGQMKLGGETLATTAYATHRFDASAIVPIDDGFGRGIRVTFANEAAGKPALNQVYSFYEAKSFFLTRLDAVSDAELTTNYMAPIAANRLDAVQTGRGAGARVLTVPFDNDNWIRFKAQNVNRSDTSYEVTAVYDNDSRQGLVIGSVTHDKWKTGIDWSGSSDKLNKLVAYGGASSTVTHDTQAHGNLSGTTVSSPTMLAGAFADYRDGLETYGQANAIVAPPLELGAGLPQGVPVGWNSWGAFGSDLSYQDVIDTSNYFKTHLPALNNGGAFYINLDSYWDNLTEEQLRDAVSVIKGNGQQAGIYWGPFVYWGNNMGQTVEGTDGAYTYGDIVLKDADGQPLPTLDGAYALDPTHPGTKQRIDYYLGRFKSLGFTYIKLDFLTHGSLEGSHYDETATGIQAYNEGMAYIDQVRDGSMFISESISPIFPSQYAHSRRISCDTYGAINETEYELNSLTYGWWQNGTIYSFTDPDHMALSRAGSLAEARSRVNSAVISGTVFLDSDDVNNETAQQYMQELYTHPLVNALAVRGEAFRPVEGNTGANATNVFVLKDGNAAYAAVFNYDGRASANGTLNLARLGLQGNTSYDVIDLWTGTKTAATGSLAYTLQPAESLLLKLTPKSTPIVTGPSSSAPETPTEPEATPDRQEKQVNGAEGGALALEGGIAVRLPAGAFDGALAVTLRKLAAGEAPEAGNLPALSPVFGLAGGERKTLLRPAQITLTYDADLLPEGARPAVYYYNEERHRWIYLGGAATGSDGIVAAEASRFADYAVFAYTPVAFADLQQHWSAAYTDRLVGMGVIAGFEDGTFRPNEAVTRAQIAKLLVAALGSPSAAPADGGAAGAGGAGGEGGTAAAGGRSADGFADADAIPVWASVYVAQAEQAGWLQGIQAGGQTFFEPGRELTRAELAQLVARLLPAADGAPAGTAAYADAASIPAWATAAVERLQGEGLMTGSADGRFRPADPVTRAEAAKVLALLLTKLYL